MAATRQPPASDSIALEIDARIVRSEAIRAIRGFMTRTGQPGDTAQKRSKPTSFYAIVCIMRDLELTLAAISGSLAEGVEHATGGQSKSHDDSVATPTAGAGPKSTG